MMGSTATGRTQASARPDQAAHREALSLPFSGIVSGLVAILGRKLTAYIGGAKDTRTVDRWIEGGGPYNSPEDRIRLAYQVAKMLAEHDSPGTVQAWFTGLNPDLGDRAPARLFRDDDFDAAGRQVLAAARSFLAGG